MKKFLSTKFGINEDQLKPSMEVQSDRLLLMDGDAACYEAATTLDLPQGYNGERQEKFLERAMKKVEEKILTTMFLTESTKARVHITPKWSLKANRKNIKGFNPYQANRDPNAKPFMLEPIRDHLKYCMQNKYNNIEVIENMILEADDGVVCDTYTYKDKDILVWSTDKDLRVVNAPYYEISTGMIDTIKERFGYIRMGSTETGNKKPMGHGTKFFWWQMLMGDTADNIKGLAKLDGKSVGPVRALKLIEGIDDESYCANVVLRAYKEINQNPLPEGALLWLLRSEQDSVIKYWQELDLTKDVKDFLNACYRLDWH